MITTMRETEREVKMCPLARLDSLQEFGDEINHQREADHAQEQYEPGLE
jgi:hypothetical protein